MKMDITIRNERISDFNSIANVNYEAFLGWHPENQFVTEPIMVDLLRHNSMFDSELSLVAEFEGKVIGHAIFSPFKFIVLGEEQPGVILGPVAIKPEFQNKGIGSMLIKEGHRKAKEKGYAFSLLCGHVEYYPRFGYKTGMFSLSGAKVTICANSFDNEGFSDRPVNEKDIGWILEVWEEQHSSDTLALLPGRNISEWCNHGMQCRCSVITRDSRILGYVRYVNSTILNIKELAAKIEDIPDMLSYLAWKRYGKAQGDIGISIPVEKLQAALGNVSNYKISDEHNAYRAFMIKILEHKSPIADYCKKVEKRLIKPGVIAFPAMFDVDDGRNE